jgi:hypothetical protein
MRTFALKPRLVPSVAVVTAVLGAGVCSPVAAAAPSTVVARIVSVYQTVLNGEYFGPASAVCSHLTAQGVKSYTAGSGGSCAHAFAQAQRVLTHKTRGVDDSGYTPSEWRQIVGGIVEGLRVTVHGHTAIAGAGPSGIPSATTLVEVKGRWLFNVYPPSIEP